MLVTNLELGLIDFNSLKCSMWKFLLFEINVTKKVILATGFLTSVSYDPRVNSRVVTPFASFGWLFNDRNHDSFGIAAFLDGEMNLIILLLLNDTAIEKDVLTLKRK